ncbi:MAG: thiolase, partial [Sphingomonadales bacterium]|nr:thiolase [Sphingomonadales bacterium]
MGDRFPRGRVSVAGAATFGVGEAPGFATIEIAAQAVRLALDDAGIALGEVDGIFVALPDDLFGGLSLAQYLGLHPRFTDNNRTGGASFMSHVVTAVALLEAGYIDCAVIAHGANQ